MNGSNTAGGTWPLDSSENLIKEKNWEREFFYLLASALVGGPFSRTAKTVVALLGGIVHLERPNLAA
jgi:hypothetical protein